jgi:integrase
MEAGMALTDVKARGAKALEKPYKLTDERGMFLLVNPTGSKLWRFKYRIHGREKLLSLGQYPDVGLRDARERREEARKLVAAGQDPSEHRRSVKQSKRREATNTFEAVARDWHSRQAGSWTEDHARRVLTRLERDAFPWVGRRPVSHVDAAEILELLRRVEQRGAIETAHRLKSVIGQVFGYAIATRRATRNPVPDLSGALQKVKARHRAAITDPVEVGALLRALEGYQGAFVTRSALQLAPMLFTRPGELRNAEWGEIDLERGEWNIPAEKMKMREPHLVPLPRQAVRVLRELRGLTGEGRYVFPSARSQHRPMSNNAVLSALRRMGFAKEEMSGHGMRALARTLLDEELGFRVDIIEHQLAHAVQDPNGRAYNRTSFLAERRKMMQAWADYLDQLRAGVPLMSLGGMEARA